MDLEKYMKWTNIKKDLGSSTNQIVVLASFTVEPLEPYLGLDVMEKGEPYIIKFGVYNQIIQQLTDMDSLVYQGATKKIIIWPRLEDLVEYQMQFGIASYDDCVSDAQMIVDAVLGAQEKNDKEFYFILPAKYEAKPAGLGDYQTGYGMEALYLAYTSCFLSQLSGKERIVLCDAEEIIRQISVEKALDPSMYAVAKIPYSDQMFSCISQMLVRAMELKENMNNKLLFDAAMFLLDEYDIEGNVVQDITEEEIGRSDSIRKIQTHMNTIGRWGGNIVLYTTLGEEELRKICAQSDVSLDPDSFSMIYYHCSSLADIEENLKGEKAILLTPVEEIAGSDNLMVAQLPEDAVCWSNAIDEMAEADFIPFMDQAVQNVKKDSRMETSGHKKGKKPELNLIVETTRVTENQLGSINHLLEAVGDFRFTNPDWNEEKLSQEQKKEDVHILGVSVKDRFGDYGVAGGILAKKEDEVLHIIELMLNCRILGKNVERIVFNQLAEYAKENQCHTIGIRFLQSDRNDIARDFLTDTFKVSADFLKENEILCSLEQVLEAVKITENDTEDINIEESKVEESEQEKDSMNVLKRNWNSKPKAVKEELIQAALSLNSVDDILHAIDETRHAGRSVETEYVEPRTETEKKMVALWEEILHVDKIGVLHNFFALGGTSILATQLIVRFQQVFNIAMPVRLFFDKSNIEQMALYIDAIKEENADLDELNTNDIENYRLNLRDFLKREVSLEESINNNEARPYLKADQCKNVLLTGVTGFVGPFILSELMKRTQYKVYCLVRATTPENGFERVKANMENYYLWDDDYKERIEIICGDLEKPLLGLGHAEFNELAVTIDMIYHNGANTNFLKPYNLLKAANVGGTQEILRLAVTEKVKQVHFVSTHYVFSTISNEPGSTKYEDEIPTYREIVVMGYQQTKLVCEQMVDIARQRNIPVSIYRLGRVSGSSETGACQTGDFVWQMTKCCVESGLVFAEESNIELIPVDYVGKSVIQISLDGRCVGKNFHIINRHRVSMAFIKKWMIDRGFKVEEYPYLEWKDKLTECVAKSEKLKAVKTMLPFITEDNTVLDQELVLDTANTDEILEGTDVERVEVDPDLFSKYLDYFIKVGYFQVDQKEEI